LHLDWLDVVVRLGLTCVAGAAIGMNREATGHAAGLRTTLLVCLAASVSMIQMSLLLPVSGKAHDSFSVMDVMRLPLGILTGVGFIGAGAILRRGDLVLGVTTASTIWMATVVGLCLGGGQLALGTAAAVVTVVVLWGVKQVEEHLPKRGRAIVSIAVKPQASPDRIAEALGDVDVRLLERRWEAAEACRLTRYEVRFASTPQPLLARLETMSADPDVVKLKCTVLRT
jgi:putative Mg2+ transporter-C (MgtC) family protein